jgi:hypothetical protein
VGRRIVRPFVCRTRPGLGFDIDHAIGRLVYLEFGTEEQQISRSTESERKDSRNCQPLVKSGIMPTAGLASAAISGTHSTLVECAPPASISGVKRSASRAADGRRIRIGMRTVTSNGGAD